MHAVNVSTGVEQPGFPVLIQGTATNDPNTTFKAQFEMQRTGLTIVNGVVYAGFGGHCDYPPYLGWVVGVSTAGQITSMWADTRPMDVDEFAHKALAAIARDEFIIVLPRWWKALWYAERISPYLGLAIWGKILARMRKQLEAFGARQVSGDEN